MCLQCAHPPTPDSKVRVLPSPFLASPEKPISPDSLFSNWRAWFCKNLPRVPVRVPGHHIPSSLTGFHVVAFMFLEARTRLVNFIPGDDFSDLADSARKSHRLRRRQTGSVTPTLPPSHPGGHDTYSQPDATMTLSSFSRLAATWWHLELPPGDRYQILGSLEGGVYVGSAYRG